MNSELLLETYLKAVGQKMLDNHINSHPETELKATLDRLNATLLRPKGPNRRRKNRRSNKKIKEKIAILSKLLGIP